MCSRAMEGWKRGGKGLGLLGAAWRSALSLVAKRMASTESSDFSSEKSAHCHTQERSEPAFSLSEMLGRIAQTRAEDNLHA